MDGALLSLQVRVRLVELSLRSGEAPETFNVERRLPERLLPVVWRPHGFPDRRTGVLEPSLDDPAWLMPGRVEVQVVARALGDPQKQEIPNLLGSAASRSALQFSCTSRSSGCLRACLTRTDPR